MGIKNREYSFGVNSFNKPTVVEGKNAIGARLMELIMMEPGDDPLHPEMGVGLRTYRYGVNNVDQLQTRIEEQIRTYLPFYQNVEVKLVTTPDKICNIEITLGDTVFIYDSINSSKPIILEDIQNY